MIATLSSHDCVFWLLSNTPRERRGEEERKDQGKWLVQLKQYFAPLLLFNTPTFLVSEE